MKRRFKVEFNRDKCKGCELCVNACPKKILALDSNVNVKGYHPAGITDQESCIGCTMPSSKARLVSSLTFSRRMGLMVQMN